MNEKFFLKLLELSAAHAKRSHAIFERLNLSNAQPKVLYILRETDGYTQKELASICRITPPSMTSILNNMEKADFIYREKVLTAGQKHAHKIYLTTKKLLKKFIPNLKNLKSYVLMVSRKKKNFRYLKFLTK